MHDSEVAAGIYETSTDSVLRYRLAHWLRIQIWKEHLNMRTEAAIHANPSAFNLSTPIIAKPQFPPPEMNHLYAPLASLRGYLILMA
jgi:hypothetical protein